MYVFDIETNGLLPDVSTVHCINMIDPESGVELRFTDHEFYQELDGTRSDVPTPRDGTIEEALRLLSGSDVAGHNIIGYDVPVLSHIYNEWAEPETQIDTQIYAQLLFPDVKSKDFRNIDAKRLPEDFAKQRLVGSHSLKAWGIRFGGQLKADFNPKDYGHTWATMPFTQEMDDYCMQDVRTNVDVLQRFEAKNYSPEAVELEMDVAKIIRWQERTGIRFDTDAAGRLELELRERQYELEQQCRAVFPPFYTKNGKPKSFKRDMRRKVKGQDWKEWCEAGAEHQPVELVAFNPGSARHIEVALKRKYDWEPTEFTPTGLAKIDEDVLSSLPFEEAKLVGEYKLVTKRLSQLADGTQGWMRKVAKDGRIYGRVNQLGTVTGRMSHYGPNLAQVPANYAPYGERCRALFLADEDRALVGCDADALELRVLAHFMARFDEGEYVDTVLSGSKEQGTDMHTRNRIAVRLEERDTAKTWFYAFIYGAQDFKLGTIVMSEWPAEKLTRFYSAFPPGRKRQSKIRAIGARSRARLLESLPAFKDLVRTVQEAAKRGHLRGLDKREIPIRGMHAALNSLCQSAGAVIMKKALVIMFKQFREEGLDVRPLLNIHDEVQLSCEHADAKRAGSIAADAIRQAGEHYSFRCPLAGDYDIGESWAATH